MDRRSFMAGCAGLALSTKVSDALAQSGDEFPVLVLTADGVGLLKDAGNDRRVAACGRQDSEPLRQGKA